jgi:hypothetical protein
VTGFLKDEITLWGKRHLSPFSMVVSDGLNGFPGVTEASCSHEAIITHTDNGYDEFNVFKWVNVMIGNEKNALHGTYHHVSATICPVISQSFVIGLTEGSSCMKW